MKAQEAKERSVIDGLGLLIAVAALSFLLVGVVFGAAYWLTGKCFVSSGLKLEDPEVERVRAFIAGAIVTLLLFGLWRSGMH